MSTQVDDLFGGEDSPEPSLMVPVVLASAGLLIAVVGLAFLSAPGALLVLAGLWRVERELDKVDNGYLDMSVRPSVLRVRWWVFAALTVVVMLLLAQIVLYSMGFYQLVGDYLFRQLLPGLFGASA